MRAQLNAGAFLGSPSVKLLVLHRLRQDRVYFEPFRVAHLVVASIALRRSILARTAMSRVKLSTDKCSALTPSAATASSADVALLAKTESNPSISGSGLPRTCLSISSSPFAS